MERGNLESLMGNSSTFQEFSMTDNYQRQPEAGFFATGNLDSNFWEAGSYRQPNFWATGNHRRQDAAAGNHHLNLVQEAHHLPPAINSYHARNLALLDSPLESEFSRLSLTPAIRPPSYLGAAPAYDAIAASPQQHLSVRDIQRMRIQSAARGQMGLYTPPEQDFDSFNGIPGYDHIRSLYNSGGGRGLNGAALDYFRSPYEIGHGSSMNLNRSIGNSSEYRSLSIEPNNNSLSMVSGSMAHRPRQRPIFSSLKELRGRIVSVAKDQHGCRFLQNKFEEGSSEEIQMIFVEVKDHICELMVHQFGNYLIQKFLEVCNQDQMNQLLMLVTDDDLKFTDICSDMYGTRAVQKLLEHLTTPEQVCRVICVLRRITVALTKSMNGHHVIQYCLKFFSIEDNKHILNVVADNCLDIATDKSGCCVLQQCVEHSLGEPRVRLIAEITSNALILSEHPYGNYVVQYILGLKIEQATKDIMAQLSGNYVSLSMNKYGSNVVERCLRESDEYQNHPIIEEIIRSPNFLRVLQDPYGNYVAQSALAMSKGDVRHAMTNLILANYPNLHSHPHGKRVLARTKGSKMYV